MSVLVTVADPDLEVIPSRKVHNMALYRSGRLTSGSGFAAD